MPEPELPSAEQAVAEQAPAEQAVAAAVDTAAAAAENVAAAVNAPVEAIAEAAPASTSPEYTAALKTARGAGFRKAAEQAYLKVLEINPASAEALSGLAMFYLNQGKNDLARDRAQQSVGIDPKNSEGWIVLAASRAALGDMPGARKAYQECAAIEGKFAGECKRMLR
jgi:tetratricopeptide (TPR) repeat protein